MYQLVEVNKNQRYVSQEFATKEEAEREFNAMQNVVKKYKLLYDLFIMETKTGNITKRYNAEY